MANEAQNKYYRKNKDKISSKKRVFDRQQGVLLREAIMSNLGFECVRCGFSDIRALQIDHINGGGSKERSVRGTQSYYKIILNKIISGSTDYQILCANCNWIKRVENKEINHGNN